MNNSLAHLIRDFAEASAKHYHYTLEGNSRKTNSEANKVTEAFKKVIEFGDTGRQSLLALLDHEDPAVASMAAVYSLKFDSLKSLSTLKAISRRAGLIGFEARQAIQRWEEGDWHLE